MNSLKNSALLRISFVIEMNILSSTVCKIKSLYIQRLQDPDTLGLNMVTSYLFWAYLIQEEDYWWRTLPQPVSLRQAFDKPPHPRVRSGNLR